MTSIVATILITGMVAMSSPQVFAHKLITELGFEIDPTGPVVEGTDVLMTGNVTTFDTPEDTPPPQDVFHPAENPVITGIGKIQQGLNADNSTASVCQGPEPDHWADLDTTLVSVAPLGNFTHLFNTTGLGGETLVFRAHYSTSGGAHGTTTIPFSECIPLEITAAGDPFDGFKTWTHTDYNWDKICDDLDDGTLNVNATTGECLVGFRDANINFNGNNTDPDDDVLADSLDPPTEDGISDVLLQVKKNGEISNMNPGAIYALTTVNVLADLDMLQVEENYGNCTDVELELLNQNNLSRNVKAAVANSNGNVTEVTDRLYNGTDPGVVFVGITDNNSTTVKINDTDLLTDGSTVFVLVKFDDQLKGVNYDSINGTMPFTCLNEEVVTSTIGEDLFDLTFNATLRFTEAP